MTVSYDPGEEHGAANQLRVLATDFHGDDDYDPGGDGPDHRAAKGLHSQIHRTGKGLGDRLDEHGRKIDDDTTATENQDQHSGGKVAQGIDAAGAGSLINGMLGPVNAAEQTFGQAFSGLAQGVLGIGAQLGSAIGNVASQMAGAVTKNANIGGVPSVDVNQGGGEKTGGTTAPSSSPLGPPVTSKGGDKPPERDDDHVRLVSQSVGGQPMSGMGMVRPPIASSDAGGNPLPTKTVRIVTDKERKETI